MIASGQDSLIRARRGRWQRGRWRRRRQWGSDRSGWRPGASPRPSPGQALPVGPQMGPDVMLEVKAGGEGAGGAAAKERLAHGSAECGVDRMSPQPRCLIPRFDGAILSFAWKEAVWDRYVTGVPRPRTPSEQQYSTPSFARDAESSVGDQPEDRCEMA